MNKTEFIRFALVLSDGQASTFRKNLTKIIKLILFDNFGSPLNTGEILKQAKEKYSLEFCDSEICDAIKNDRTQSFIEMRNSPDPVYYTYTITPEEYDKLKNKSSQDKFTNIAFQFAAISAGEFKYNGEEIKSIILRYIYYIFNSDINTVLSLMNYSGNKIICEVSSEHFSENEKSLLNTFLNWNDKDKNQFVFLVLSSCYEYCMMTVKKDNSAFSHIFNGKEFFLDANVLFRLAGFNNNERREVVEAFLRKCKECNIKIKYTNFTNNEINNTLNYKVEAIKRLLNGHEPISFLAMKSISPKYANLDLYPLYIDWIKNTNHKSGEYTAFLSFLKLDVQRHLSQMTFVAVESIESMRENKDFTRLCEDFTAYKTSRNKDPYEGSIKIDIENYLYIQKLNSTVESNSFLDKKYFFITTDHSYINWAKEKIPGSIPAFVLPSVWYSIILKYKGRTDNDYNAFCQFLNLRISTPEDKLSQQKEEILRCVLNIDETTEIKEQMIFDICQRLSEETEEITNIENFVHESHTRIAEIKVLEALSISEKSHNIEKESLQQKSEQEIEANRKAGYDAGFTEAIEKLINTEAEQKVNRNKGIRIVCHVIALVFVSVAILALVLTVVFAGETASEGIISFINKYGMVLTLIFSLVAAGSFICTLLNKYVEFLSVNKDIIAKRLKKKKRMN